MILGSMFNVLLIRGPERCLFHVPPYDPRSQAAFFLQEVVTFLPVLKVTLERSSCHVEHLSQETHHVPFLCWQIYQ